MFGSNKKEETEKKVSEEDLVNKYQQYYDRNVAIKLLKKLRKSTRNKSSFVSKPVEKIINTLGCLLSALDNPAMPTHYKALVIGAIGYIILPIDLIPDAIPVIGYTDDLASVAGVLAMVAGYSTFSLSELDAQIDQENGENFCTEGPKKKEPQDVYKEIITFKDVRDFALEEKKKLPQIAAFLLLVQKNLEPKNENDNFIVVQGFLDANKKPITLNGEEAESRILHTRTIDKILIQALNGSESVIITM